MKFAIHFVAAVLVAVSGSAPARAADNAMSSGAMLALSAKAADTKAKRDLLSILEPTGRFRKGDGIDTSIEMHTIPRGTAMKGLCARDELSLRYMPAKAASDPDPAPRRPAGLDLQRAYHANPGVRYVQEAVGTPRTRPAGDLWASDCSALRPDKTASWFLAKDDEEAAATVEIFLAAMEALRVGQLKAENCGHALKNGESCTRAVLRLAQVQKIDVAGDSGPCGEGRSCFGFYFAGAEDLGLSVTFVPGRNSPVSAKDIVSVTANEAEPPD